jgi:hypothetical protein
VASRKFLIGLVLTALGLAGGGYAVLSAEQAEQAPFNVILASTGGILIIVGIALSVGEIVKSVVKRLKAAREREKANRDRQRQARQNKER